MQGKVMCCSFLAKDSSFGKQFMEKSTETGGREGWSGKES